MDSSRKKLLKTIGIAILVILVTGVTFAFFNYTRTGLANNIRVGRIYFKTNQNSSINLTNVSPITSSDLSTDIHNHDSVTITITGDTTYNEGIEYLVTFTNVNNTINNKLIPLGFKVESNGIGTSSSDYYNERGSDTSYYLLTDSGIVEEDKYILVGYIAPGQEGINGNILLNAYIDADSIAITDTYDPREPNYVHNPNIKESQITACVNYLTQTWGEEVEGSTVSTGETYHDFCAGTGTNYGNSFQDYYNNLWFSNSNIEFFIEQNILIDSNVYTDLTTAEWVNGRTVFTTSEWNSFKGNNSLSFKVKVEANEGIWVDQEPTPARCFTTSEPKIIYKYNDHMNATELANCEDYFDSWSFNYEEDVADFCAGTGTMHGVTLPEMINSKSTYFYNDQLLDLADRNIIISTGNYEISIIDYNVSCDTNVVIPKKMNSSISSDKYNSNRQNNDINDCISYLEYKWGPESSVDDPQNYIWQTVQEGETYHDFCAGTGTNWGMTFQEYINYDYFDNNDVAYFKEHNNIVEEIQIVNNAIVTEVDGYYDSYYDIRYGAFEDKGLTGVIIPNTVTSIGRRAFISNQLIDIVIPSSIEIIDNYAFANNLLSNLNIPNSVKGIGDNAFRGNTITSLTIDSTKIIGSKYNEYNCADSFTNKIGLNQVENITFGDNVENIGECAFSNISPSVTIKNVTFGNRLTTVGNKAFSNNEIESVIIPESVTTIDKYAFYNNKISSLNIGNNVQRINMNAFSYNQLESLTIPDSVSCIEIGAFTNNSITSLFLGEGITRVDYDSSVTTSPGQISFYAIDWNQITYFDKVNINDHFFYVPVRFDNKPSFGVLTLGEHVKTIGVGAFYGTSISEVVIGNGVTSIGGLAFFRYSKGIYDSNVNLSKITIDKTCAEITSMSYYPWIDSDSISDTIGLIPTSIYGSNNELCGRYTPN